MRNRAVLLDALGTLVELEPPWTHLSRALEIPDSSEVQAAFKVEMGHYRDHAHEARDEQSLIELRRECASLLSRELGTDVSVELMMRAIRFRAYPDARPALERLAELGQRLVCVSNWDYQLPRVLNQTGLRDALDGVVTSAEVGARKPDPEIFFRALELADCSAGEAIHVGDTATEDIEGARAAGIEGLLLNRDGDGQLGSLAEIEEHLRS